MRKTFTATLEAEGPTEEAVTGVVEYVFGSDLRDRDFGAVELIGKGVCDGDAVAELAEARATIARLNRRCQAAESGLLAKSTSVRFKSAIEQALRQQLDDERRKIRALRAALDDLLNTCELNMDEMEPATLKTIERIRPLVQREV